MMRYILIALVVVTGCGVIGQECIDCNCPGLIDDMADGTYRINQEGSGSDNIAAAAGYPLFATTVTDLVVSVDSRANTLTFAYTVSGETQSTVWTYKD